METSASIVSDSNVDAPLPFATAAPLALQKPSTIDSSAPAQHAGVISPLTPEATEGATAVGAGGGAASGGAGRRSITEEMVMGLHSSPRNSLIMRRRSVDMSFMMQAKASESLHLHDPTVSMDAALLPDSVQLGSTSSEIAADGGAADIVATEAVDVSSEEVGLTTAVQAAEQGVSTQELP